MKSLNLKYENMYIMFAMLIMITQIIIHIKNDITISNLILEIIAFVLIHSIVYYSIYEYRQNKKELKKKINNQTNNL